jgi:hypothetical protein
MPIGFKGAKKPRKAAKKQAASGFTKAQLRQLKKEADLKKFEPPTVWSAPPPPTRDYAAERAERLRQQLENTKIRELNDLMKVLPIRRDGPRYVLVVTMPRTGDFYVVNKQDGFKGEMALLGIDVVFLDYVIEVPTAPKLEMFLVANYQSPKAEPEPSETKVEP